MEVSKENALSLIKTSDFWKDDLKQAVVILQNSREIQCRIGECDKNCVFLNAVLVTLRSYNITLSLKVSWPLTNISCSDRLFRVHVHSLIGKVISNTLPKQIKDRFLYLDIGVVCLISGCHFTCVKNRVKNLRLNFLVKILDCFQRLKPLQSCHNTLEKLNIVKISLKRQVSKGKEKLSEGKIYSGPLRKAWLWIRITEVFPLLTT